MKNLEALIEKTSSLGDKNVKQRIMTNEKSLVDKMFDIADKVTDKLDSESVVKLQNDLEKRKNIFKNITFSMPIETEQLLNELVKNYMMRTGEIGKKSHIICAALDMIKELEGDKFVEIVSQKNNQYK